MAEGRRLKAVDYRLQAVGCRGVSSCFVIYFFSCGPCPVPCALRSFA